MFINDKRICLLFDSQFGEQLLFSSLKQDFPVATNLYFSEKEHRLYNTLQYEKVHLQTTINHFLQVSIRKLLNFSNLSYIRFPGESIQQTWL